VAPFDGGVLIGATFDRLDQAGGTLGVHIDAESRRRNLEALAQLAPGIAASVDPERLHSRASLRAATPDYAPIMGALPDAAEWRALNVGVAHGAAPVASPVVPGVYVIGGLGARGLTLAPLLGECVAVEIFDEPRPLSRSALDAIDPARFLLRALKKR
jgi:tRNA 5-methylaminomethyl-2-thiouridine biosynthesis bifunctional protein